ncbi:protein 5NUC-like [Sergentomyia squamirostris]
MLFGKVILGLCLMELGQLVQCKRNQKNTIDIILLHTNDMHGSFEETDAKSNTCHKNEIKCYGGFPRIAHMVKKYRKDNKNVIFLNAGDTFTGTPAFSIFKHNITSEMMNFLSPNAASLGNHEFDNDIQGLVPYLKELKYPVLAANIDTSGEPTMADLLKRSVTIKKGGLKIGIIGYLTTDTKFLSKPNNLKFTSEIEAINEEAKKLKDKGVNVIIVVGHSGLIVDRQIAENCSEVDLVVGGHSHTFLYTGNPPDSEVPKDDYPVVVTQSSGKKVPIVQAYAYTKYLGYLKLTFNSSGALLKWEGQPILLDNKIPQDPAVLKALQKYLPKIEEYSNRVVGETRVFLNGDGTTCRFRECNLGNLITDAFINANVIITKGNKSNGKVTWTDASVVLYQAGGIRAAIDASNSDGFITKSELDKVLPFGGHLHIVPVRGSIIRAALEHAVHRYTTKVGNGEFLQMSGVKVIYDLSETVGSRVKGVTVRCANCTVPRYENLVDTSTYNVIINSFVKDGGDGYEMFKNLEILKTLPAKDIEMVEAYIERMSPIYPAVEGRIILKGKPKE